MQRLGILLIILGIGTFILPLAGLQFRIISFLGESGPIAAGVLLVAGIIILVANFRSNRVIQTGRQSRQPEEPMVKCKECSIIMVKTEVICPKCHTEQ